MRYLLGMFFAAAFLGFIWIFGAIDTTMNYETVSATVTSVKDECHLERTSRGVVGKTRESSEWMDCKRAFAILDRDASAHGAEIIRRTYVKFNYISPADRQNHSGSLSYMGVSNPGTKVSIGGTITVSAHTSEPGSVQKI